MPTLFELKENMATLQASINEDASWIAEKAADPNTSMADIDAKTAHRDELQKRFALLKKEHDSMEEAQRTSVAIKSGGGEGMTAKDAVLKAKAKFYRAALTGGSVQKLYEGLGGIPAANADLGKGDNLLPKNVSDELLLEPLEDNPLRDIEPVTNITGLEEQKLGFVIEDENLEDVLDTEVAKEIQTDGDTISYGRFKTKVSVTIKDTVLHGSDHDLVSAVENGLRSALAVKEKMNACRTVSDSTHDHMSFYLTGIKTVKKPTLIKAIKAAWAELPEAFSANATCVMRKIDYYDAIEEMTNGNDTLWGKKPEDVLGVPVKFLDRAVKPIVGDFRYAKQNYDIGTIFETDKNAKKGEYYFVLTAWGDHQIRLKSAFRIAEAEQPLP